MLFRSNDDMYDQSGDGFRSFVQGIPNSLTTRPKILNDLINDKDDVLIKSLYVCRQPIYKIFEMGLNILTLGQLKEQMKRLGYDNLYHLYLIINFEDGSQHFIEKNQRVNTGKYVKQDEEECTQPIPFNKTLKDLIETAEARRIPGFYRYNAFSDNCQRFAYDVMNSNGIDQFNGFILQDVKSLAPSWIKTAAHHITDVAGIVDYVYRGGSAVDGVY